MIIFLKFYIVYVHRFSDNKWYRCNIIEKLSDHEYVLHSVDYGYEHKLESCDMRRLTNEFGTKLECTAVRYNYIYLYTVFFIFLLLFAMIQ